MKPTKCLSFNHLFTYQYFFTVNKVTFTNGIIITMPYTGVKSQIIVLIATKQVNCSRFDL